MAKRTTGTVRWYDGSKGYGYITVEDEPADVFVHYADIVANGVKSLRVGDRVEFYLEQSYRGPQATEVVRL